MNYTINFSIHFVAIFCPCEDSIREWFIKRVSAEIYSYFTWKGYHHRLIIKFKIEFVYHKVREKFWS